MKAILFVLSGASKWRLADGSEDPCGYWPEELVVPHRIFTDAGHRVFIATPGGRPAEPEHAGFTPEANGGSVEAGQALREYVEAMGDELRAPKVLEDIDPADFDAVYLPGGHAPMADLATSVELGAQLVEFQLRGAPVAAICHGVAALLPARVDDGSWAFAGYRLTGFTNVEEAQLGYADRVPWLLEDRVRADGGVFRCAERPWEPQVVVDRMLLTGQNPASSQQLADELVRHLAR